MEQLLDLYQIKGIACVSVKDYQDMLQAMQKEVAELKKEKEILESQHKIAQAENRVITKGRHSSKKVKVSGKIIEVNEEEFIELWAFERVEQTLTDKIETLNNTIVTMAVERHGYKW